MDKIDRKPKIKTKTFLIGKELKKKTYRNRSGTGKRTDNKTQNQNQNLATSACGIGVTIVGSFLGFSGPREELPSSVKKPMIMLLIEGYRGTLMSAHPQIPLCCPCGSFQLFCRGWCLACYGRRSRSRARFGGLREKILARDHHRCRVCGAREWLVVHHRHPRHTYDSLITLCAACHARLHRLGAIHRWVPEPLLELWAELHPGAPRQLQLPASLL